jgi:hypothetical protein
VNREQDYFLYSNYNDPIPAQALKNVHHAYMGQSG